MCNAGNKGASATANTRGQCLYCGSRNVEYREGGLSYYCHTCEEEYDCDPCVLYEVGRLSSAVSSCPFCGGKAMLYRETKKKKEEEEEWWHVVCTGCYTRSDGYYSAEDARDRWNRRYKSSSDDGR